LQRNHSDKMDEFTRKDNQRALIGTIIFHVVLLVLFFLWGLRTPLPLPEEEGVLVALGYTNQGMGDMIPLSGSPPVPTPAQQVPVQEEVVTQSTQESVAIPQTTPRPRPQQPTPAQQQPTQQPPPEEPRPQVDPRALFPGTDERSTTSQSQGTTGQPGSQGSPTGAAGGSGDGVGQGGVSYNLTGRRPNQLPIPSYDTQAQGRVVVSITVDRQGRVTRATAGARGTTTTDPTLWRLAVDAARRARFDVQLDAPEEQTGTITYNFIRQN
jgi:TonB family protein